MKARIVYITSILFLLLEYTALSYIKLKSEIYIYYVPGTIIFLGLIQYFFLERKIKKQEIDFTIYFVAVNGAKFILLLFGILLYIVYISKNNTEFLIIFFVNYFFSLTLINSKLILMLKKNK